MQHADQSFFKIKCIAVPCILLLCVIITYVSSVGQWRIFYIPVIKFNGKNAGQKPKGQLHHKMLRPLRPISQPERPYLILHYPEKNFITAPSERMTSSPSSKQTTNYTPTLSADDSQKTIHENHVIKEHLPVDKSREKTAEHETEKADLTENRSSMFEIQIGRIKQVNDMCKDENLLSNMKYKRYDTKYYYSKTYNFTYCKVPKAGSTFWTQVFKIINNGRTKDIFNQDRMDLHQHSRKLYVPFNSKKRKHSASILVSRNPYSRLYSAFIDKSFLFLAGVNFEVRKQFPKSKETSCPLNVSFNEFLDFIISRVRSGKRIDKHWSPITNLCRPCHVNARVLVKQESFSADVEYALRAFKVDDKKLNTILPALHNNRIEDSLPGIIGTVYRKTKRLCIDEYTITERIWKSLQIQGFLREDLKFPAKKFEKKLINSKLMVDVVMYYIKKFPLTSQERKTQRHKALVDAYKYIKIETLKEIQKLFEVDFKIFGYDSNPPGESAWF